MKNRYLKTPALLSGLLLTSSPAFSAITYVDAQEGAGGNTFATGGSLSTTTWINLTSNSANVNNSNWVKRFGGNPGWTQHNGGDVIQAAVTTGNSNTLGEITTQVTGLADGNYDVWVFFWEQIVSGSENWVIDAGISSGAQSSYSSSAGPVAGSNSTIPVNANTLTFANAPSVVAAGGNQNMFAVNLGQVAVAGGSNIEVYVDKLFGNGTSNRTIYDGVGYELVSIPEPSSSLLLALAGLAITARRRR